VNITLVLLTILTDGRLWKSWVWICCILFLSSVISLSAWHNKAERVCIRSLLNIFSVYVAMVTDCNKMKTVNIITFRNLWDFLQYFDISMLTEFSQFFLLKKVLERKEGPKIQSERGGVSCTNTRKKLRNIVPAWVVLRNYFVNGALVHSITKIPLNLVYKTVFSCLHLW
jgi:hypothetical protein